VLDLPAGPAGADFHLRIDGFGDANRVSRQLTDKDGNVVSTLSAGTGDTLEYPNLATGQTYLSTSNGAVSRTVVNADGSTTSVLTGHNLVILFPSDVPAGPSTTLHTGQVVVEVDAAGTFTIPKATGGPWTSAPRCPDRRAWPCGAGPVTGWPGSVGQARPRRGARSQSMR
jgi:hypothetical protein